MEKVLEGLPCYDKYFDFIQSRKKIPTELQETLTEALSKIPVSSFPGVSACKVIEIESDTSIADAVRILSENDITSAPVINSKARHSSEWKNRYVGMIDYSAVTQWVLENAELAAAALSAGSATAAGIGAGAIGAVGALALGAATPAAAAGLTIAAVGAAMAGGAAAHKGIGKDAPTAANSLGDDFYKVLLREEPFKSTKVGSIAKSLHGAPFIPVTPDSSMQSVLLLLSKYGMRSIPVIEANKPFIKNFLTQSAVVKGLQQCKGSDWFGSVSAHRIADLGLPFKSYEEVICAKSDELVLQAFERMKEQKIGGLPVVEDPGRKIVGSLRISDVRFLLLQPDLFSNFRQLVVMDFLRIISSSSHQKGAEVLSPITCIPEARVGNVIETLASGSVERVYVVDSKDVVVGVITFRDVISCFVCEPLNHLDNDISPLKFK